MIVEINNKQYNLPESWNEVKLGTFMSWYELTQSQTSDSLDYNILVLSLLMGISKEEVEDFYIQDIKDIMEELSFLNTLPDTIQKSLFIVTNDNNEVVKYVSKDNHKLKVKEQLTIEHLLKDQNDNTKVFPEILAILIRPAIECINKETGDVEYKQHELDEDMESITRRANIFKDKLFIGEVYGTIIFFSSTDNVLSTKITRSYSSVKIIKRNQSS